MRLTPWPEVVERAGTGIAVVDATTGLVRAVNPAFAIRRGCEPEQMIGRHTEELFPPGEFARVLPRLQVADRAGHATFESEQLCTDGSVFPVLLDVTVLKSFESLPATRILQAIDISDLRRTEDERDEAEARFRALIDQAAADAVYVHDHDGRLLDVNRIGCEVLGYTRDELLGLTVFDIDVDFPREQADARWTAIRPEAPLAVVGRHRRRDGTTFPVEVHVGVALHGGQRHYLALVRDISAALTAQERLQASERRFQDICNASADWVWEVDDWGRYQFVSEGVREALGYEPSEMLGRTPFDFMPPEEGARVRQVFAELVGRREPFRNLGNVNRRKDGERRHVLTNGQPFFDRKGSLLGYRGVDRDVTDARRAELALRASEAQQREVLERRVAERTAELDRANRAKSEFLASMSHELRTPLNAIIGLSEVLKEGVAGPLDPQQQRFASDIWRAGKHLHDLINDILDLSKIEAGKLELVPTEILVRDLLAEALMVVRERAARHRIALRLDCGTEVERALLDARKVKQIAYNLLSNAVKFTADGGTITLATRGRDRDGVRLTESSRGRILPLHQAAADAYLEISVTDTGCGIAPEHFALLFEPFVQIKGEDSRPLEGTGLGLSLVRRFAELHGGTVGVESELGRGSRFVVWLPYRRVD